MASAAQDTTGASGSSAAWPLLQPSAAAGAASPAGASTDPAPGAAQAAGAPAASPTAAGAAQAASPLPDIQTTIRDCRGTLRTINGLVAGLMGSQQGNHHPGPARHPV